MQTLRAAGVKVCVASQGKPAKTELTLALTGLRDLFGPTISSPPTRSRAASRTPISFSTRQRLWRAPDRCAVVEDTTIGVLAGRAAGMRAIGYAADSDETALREAGAVPLARLADLPALIGLPDAPSS